MYLEDYTCPVYFSVQLEPTGVTQEGVNTGAFFFFLCFFFAPPSSCGACLNFLSREGFGCPYPSSTPKLNFVYSRSFSAINRFPLPGTKVRKKPTLAEIRTRDLVARRLREYQLDHRGDKVYRPLSTFLCCADCARQTIGKACIPPRFSPTNRARCNYSR